MRQAVYGTLGVLGFLGAGYYLALFMLEPEPGLVKFYSMGLANNAAGSMTIDVVFSFLLFTVFAFVEGRRQGMKHLWVYPALTLAVALAPAMGLFFVLRERQLAQNAE